MADAFHRGVLVVPLTAWTSAVEPDGEFRGGGWVAVRTGGLFERMPLLAWEERPYPGAQLRITDADGMRITCCVTGTTGRPLSELELRPGLRARAEDRIRAARATGLHKLCLHDTAQYRVWLENSRVPPDLPAWTPMLALDGKAQLREPRRLRFPLISPAGRLVPVGRRQIRRLAAHLSWTHVVTNALERLDQLPNPD